MKKMRFETIKLYNSCPENSSVKIDVRIFNGFFHTLIITNLLKKTKSKVTKLFLRWKNILRMNNSYSL